MKSKPRERLGSQQIARAALICCGEVGYARLTVGRIVLACKGNREAFYRHFDNKEDCFQWAYRTEVERLLDGFRVGPGGKARSLRPILENLASFVCAEPQVARALLVEVHAAGGPALQLREDTVARLSRALESLYLDGRASSPRRPRRAITAQFMIGGITAAVAKALTDGEPERFGSEIPGLVWLAERAFEAPAQPGAGLPPAAA